MVFVCLLWFLCAVLLLIYVCVRACMRVCGGGGGGGGGLFACLFDVVVVVVVWVWVFVCARVVFRLLHLDVCDTLSFRSLRLQLAHLLLKSEVWVHTQFTVCSSV